MALTRDTLGLILLGVMALMLTFAIVATASAGEKRRGGSNEININGGNDDFDVPAATINAEIRPDSTTVALTQGITAQLAICDFHGHKRCKEASDLGEILTEHLNNRYGDQNEPWYRNPGASLRRFIGKVPILGSSLLEPLW